MLEQNSKTQTADLAAAKGHLTPSVVIVEIDLERNLCEWAGSKILDRAVKDLGVTLDDWLKFIHPDDQPILINALADNPDKRLRHLEIRFQHLDESYSWVTFSYVLKADLNQTPSAAVGTIEDHTGTRTNTNLLADRDRLASLNQELKEFAYAASHDLQEPLRTIKAFADLLTEDYHEKLDEAGREYLSFIQEATTRLQQLITDLLSYSRLNTRTERFAEIDLNNIFNEVLQNLHQKLEDTRPDIHITALPTVQGDRFKLVRLFQNLMSNALKFRDPSKVPHISVSSEEHNEHWLIKIEDNGIGIPAEQRERVFGIFFRLHSQNAYPGTGIGLAICAKIVTHHGGKIWAEEGKDGGTAVIFTISK